MLDLDPDPDPEKAKGDTERGEGLLILLCGNGSTFPLPFEIPEPSPTGDLLDKEDFKRLSCDELLRETELRLSFEDPAAAPAAPTAVGKQAVEPFGLGEGEFLGEGVVLGVRLGNGNNCVSSSSSSIGEDLSSFC